MARLTGMTHAKAPSEVIDPDPLGPGPGINFPAHHGSGRSQPDFVSRSVGPFLVTVTPPTALSPLHHEGARLQLRSAAGTFTVGQRSALLSLFAKYHVEQLERVDELARFSAGMGWVTIGCHVDASEAWVDLVPADLEAFIAKLAKIGG